jgi:DsbC/DsbD-like thiol-disulfide interchange protein
VNRVQSCLVFLALILLGACEKEKPIVTVDPPARIDITPGESAEAVVAITIASGYHVQANPAADELLVPLTLDLNWTGWLDIGKPVYPPPERHRLEWSDLELLTYTGRVLIPLPLRVSKSAAPGLRLMSGSLHYQACSRHTCRPPKTMDFQIAIRIQS